MIRLPTRWGLVAAAGGTVSLLGLLWLAWLYFLQPVMAQPSTNSGGTSSQSARNAEGPLRVKVVRPTVEHFRHTTKQPAHVEPFEKTDVYAKAAGYLGRLGPALGPEGKPLLGPDGKPRDLDIGDRVDKGQLLAELHVPEMIAELELKKAA